MLAAIYAINALFNIIYTLVLIDVFASWIPFLYSKRVIAKILYMIHSLIEPFLSPIRKLMAKTPFGGMPLDFSPVILLILLNVLRNIILTILMLVF
ncbi:MAG: YggT family protein [Clostridia bacterium]|nr:YggT family protein [Clostridia bacterium]MBR2877531.1 YggT family protein [Clostridia bacterium]MBR2973917.1 YggT family protein [Clostridia bacterium]MBR3576075.1 YggT family protein [Clostridia bacterium]